MKTFWPKNKLLVAGLLFAAATTTYLYTTSYTSEKNPGAGTIHETTTQPSTEKSDSGQNIDKSIDKNTQKEEDHTIIENIKVPTSLLNIENETHTEQTDDSAIFVEETKKLAVTFERYYTRYDEDSFQIEEGSNVYEAMLWMQENLRFQFEGTEYGDLGFFVESLGGIANDKLRGKYWIYYVNGEKAKVGVSNYILQPHDVITWKYEHDES